MIEKLLQFSRLLEGLRSVERVIRVPQAERWENDIEHSYNLAMLAWYILDTTDSKLDREKVLRYALAHDVVEVYAGDTYIYSDDQKLLETKVERELAAVKKIAEEFPEMPELQASLQAYMQKSDPESRFVYALDKIESVIRLYLDEGRTWKEKGVTFDMVYQHKKDKVALSPEIKPYFDELMELLKSKEKELFG